MARVAKNKIEPGRMARMKFLMCPWAPSPSAPTPMKYSLKSRKMERSTYCRRVEEEEKEMLFLLHLQTEHHNTHNLVSQEQKNGLS